MIKKLTLVSLIVFFVSCNSYQSEFKNEVVSSLKELNEIPAGIDENGEITLKSIEFHCELAEDSIQEYQEEGLLVSDFIEFHYASFRNIYQDSPVQQIENFMRALYSYCNLEAEFSNGWTSVEDLEEIYINEWKQ